MPDYDIYGNVDRYSLFADARTGENVWYPTDYINHPVWGQYLTPVQTRPVDNRLYPSSTLFPGATTFTGELIKSIAPDVIRPAGMHGIGTKNTEGL